MDIVAELKDAYAFNGDPLHRKAYEKIERLRQIVLDLKSVDYVIDSHGITHHSFTIVYKEPE